MRLKQRLTNIYKKPWAIMLIKIAGKAIFAVVLLVMAAMALFLIKGRVEGVQPNLFGHQVMIVLSGSMRPEFGAGSVVFVKPAEARQLEAGDIITFKSGADSYITHRIVEVQPDGFVTRGDANNVNDPALVTSEQVVGKVAVSVPHLGYVLNYARTRAGLLTLVILPGLAIMAVEIRRLWLFAAAGDNGSVQSGGDDEVNEATG